MFRRLMLLMILLLATACTLTRTQDTPEPSVETDDTVLQIATETPPPTQTPTRTPTPTPTSTPRTAIVPLPNCTIRSSWPIYVVAGGDTLASIARRVSSSISELTTANCLTDPNLINPGQQLRVPRLPAGLPNPDTYLGTVQATPFVSANNGVYTVAANATIMLTWPEARRDATRVEFYGTPNNSTLPTLLLGTDYTPADGAAIAAVFAPGSQQLVRAIAILPNGSRQITANMISIISVENNPPGNQVQGEVIVSPYLRVENGVHILEAGQNVTLIWQGGPENEGIPFEFTLIEDGVVGPRSIGIDNNGADGVSVNWTVPQALNNARIVASTRLPGQTGASIESLPLYVKPEAVVHGTVGKLTVSPVIREDGGWIVLPAGEVVTFTWDKPPATGVERVEFYLTPTGTSMTPQLIGTDSNPADGMSLDWKVMPPFSAYLSARAFLNDGRTVEPDNLLQLTSE